MVNNNVCKYCKKQFNDWRQCNGHSVYCEFNPNSQKSKDKLSKSNNKKRQYNYKCKKCNVIFLIYCTPYKFKIGKHNKFCSRKCSNSRIQTKEMNIKRSEKLKGKTKYNIIDRECEICKTSFKLLENKKRRTCSRDCHSKLCGKQLKGKCGGYRLNGGSKKYKKGYYKSIWMDSSWETLFAKKCDENNIIWKRDYTSYIIYEIDDVKHKYYPDFYIPKIDEYIEIKGYWTDKIKNKIKYVKEQNNIKLTILESIKDIEEYFI